MTGKQCWYKKGISELIVKHRVSSQHLQGIQLLCLMEDIYSHLGSFVNPSFLNTQGNYEYKTDC
jgi:hypothetical protein